MTLTTPTNQYHNVFINDTRPTTWICSTTCTGTLVVTPTQTTTYQTSATDGMMTPYTMPSVTVTVTGTPTAAGGDATLIASPTTILTGQSSTLTLTTPTRQYHNVFINGVRPQLVGCPSGCTYTSTVTPSLTTTYQASAIDPSGAPYTMPSVTVAVTQTGPPTGSATLTATPTSITPGLSSTLMLTTTTASFNNVLINGAPLSSWSCSATCSGTLVVTPAQTTTYQATATNSAGTPYSIPSVTVVVNTPPPSTSGLIQAGNLVDTGSFDTPDGILGVDPFGSELYETEFANGAVAFNPAKNSLFVVGHDWGQHTAEISIPPVGGTATILQPFVDAEYGKLGLMDPNDGLTEGAKVGGMLVDGSKLLVSGYIYYDGAADAVASHFVRGLNLSVNDVVGPLTVGTMNPAFVGGYFAPVPPEWQGALGGDTLVGQCCLSVITRTSWGPAAFAINKADIESGKTPTPASPLVYYDADNPTLGVYDCTGCVDPAYNETTEIHGGFIPPGSSSLLIFGITGMGPVCYGAGTSDPSLAGQSAGTGYPYCYDPPRDGSQGSHAYPYSGFVWAYNLNDLAAVKAGTKNPWNVVPYATWQLPFSPIGTTFDPATGRLFVTTPGPTLSVHVLKIQ